MSQPEIIQEAPSEATIETPNKVVEFAPPPNVSRTTAELFVTHSFDNPSKNSSESAFSDDFSVLPLRPAQGKILAENITPPIGHETKLQSCNGNEESYRDLPQPKNPHKVSGIDDTNLISSFAGDHALNATTDTCGGETLATKKWETKIPKVGKKYKHKQQSRSSPLVVTEEKNVNIGEKSHMGRERRKSKYLSYPYIDPMDETKEVSNPEPEINKTKLTNLTSAEMLRKLRLTAIISMERKNSGPLKSYFFSFRTFAFLKHEEDLNESKVQIKQAKETSSNCKEHRPSSSGSKLKKVKKILKKCPNGLLDIKDSSSGTVVVDESKRETIDELDVNSNIITSSSSAAAEGSKVTGFVKLLNDVQAGAPNLIQEEGAQSNLMAKQTEAEENKVESASSGKKCSVEEAQIVAPPGFIPQHKKGNGIVAPDKKREPKRKEEGLNTTLPNDNKTAQKGKPIKRRRRNPSAPDSNVQNKSASILLNFNSGFSLPCIESIIQAFSGFGIINKSETHFVNDSSTAAQVVFVQSANANEAFQSLQKNNPFGPVLESYHFQPPKTEQIPAMNGINVLPPGNGMNSSTSVGEPPNLIFIKQQVEMMTSMLEKAGSNLSPEMRAKLESEITSFSEKVNSMVASSSS